MDGMSNFVCVTEDGIIRLLSFDTGEIIIEGNSNDGIAEAKIKGFFEALDFFEYPYMLLTAE